MDQRRKTLFYIEVFFAVMVWGASFIATKVALREVSPVTVVWLRFAMGVTVLGAAVLARKEWSLPSRREMGYFALLGFVGITFHQWLQSNGLVTAQAGTSAWIIATTPVFIALLAWLFLGERLHWRRACGIFLAAVGVLLVVSKGDFKALSAGRFVTEGDILILISAPNWALFSTLSRRGLQAHPAARMMFFVMTSGWLFTSVLFFAGPGFREVSRLTPAGWLGIAFLGVFGSGLAYIAWYDALQHLPAAQVGAFLYLEPPVAVVIAAVMLGEAVTMASLLGGGLILWGVYQVNRPARQTQVKGLR